MSFDLTFGRDRYADGPRGVGVGWVGAVRVVVRDSGDKVAVTHRPDAQAAAGQLRAPLGDRTRRLSDDDAERGVEGCYLDGERPADEAGPRPLAHRFLCTPAAQ